MKRQSGFTLIELLLVLAIIGIISAIAIPALLSQRARARDKTAIANMEGRVGDLIGQYDKLREAATASATSAITSSLGAYLTRTTGADKNPWVAGGAAFGSITALTTLGSTANTATSGMKARATTLGQAQFSIQYPTQGVNGWLGGAVLISGKVGGSSIVTKVSAIE